MLPLKVFALLAPCVLAIDLLWLGVVAKGFYAQEMGDLLRKNGETLAPRWGAAILVYLLIPLGVMLFVRPHLGEKATMWHALGWGAVFGLVVYGVYDLTCLAVMEKYTLKLTLVDMAWGATLCGGSSVLMLVIEKLVR
jgi:uncharacterized membrane protein